MCIVLLFRLLSASTDTLSRHIVGKSRTNSSGYEIWEEEKGIFA